MTYPLLRDKLTSLHPDRPQAQRTIELALAEVHSALTRLSSLGHHFHLEEGTAEQVREWPRVLYHLESSPCGRVVNSHWDYEELGPGWYGSLAEAKYHAGLEAQFAGRGGVRVPNLPMIISLCEDDFPPLPSGPSLGQRIRAERQLARTSELLGGVPDTSGASLQVDGKSADTETSPSVVGDSPSEQPSLSTSSIRPGVRYE